MQTEGHQPSERDTPRFGDDRENRRRAAVHHCSSKSTNHPERRRRVGQPGKIVEILGEREAGADREGVNRGIDQKSNAARPQHDQNRNRLERFLDRRRDEARQHSTIEPHLQQPVIQSKPDDRNDAAVKNELHNGGEAHQLEAVEIEKAQQKQRDREKSEDGFEWDQHSEVVWHRHSCLCRTGKSACPTSPQECGTDTLVCAGQARCLSHITSGV